ncbi:malonyl-coenzyme:anthocyanin 5-O-glucoside-6'''-O-malonyltransferase-like [Salvia hispanica]|uniref:malonyl-coenzyme:anthocyanin 5-O-glucoside-6'''-O-malonyltransferase-like n=1 Tax=Salvia hispanica TaxID=49212 RepID=UPI002008F2C7|nr:malonyl-coenzyme:anthocyanin 5-O-glucoside-6'''-O-malonyltransferase-like [Salvia hispanica]
MSTTVLEITGIPPPPGSTAELTLPLCFFDIVWLPFHPIRRLIFYNHPCTEAEFSSTIVPNLKHSLSRTLQHFTPVAGNLLFPLDTEKSRPFIRYVPGDAAPLTIAVSLCDFDEVTGSHARDSDQFYDFTPRMPPFVEEENYKIAPLIALQVTLFPGRGICVGVSNHHCLGDARSVFRFFSAWAETNQSGGDEWFLNCSSPPLFDRSVFGDIKGISENLWSNMRNIPLTLSSSPVPTNRVRGAFRLHQSDIKKLKDIVMSKKPGLVYISTFAVTVAYTWSVVVKSAAAAGEGADEDATEVLLLPADGRGRPNALVDPPVPVNYFGNCLGGGAATVEHKKLVAEEGFVAAAEAIADLIKNRVNNKEIFLGDLDSWLSEMSKLARLSTFGVSGSPKFDLSNADFGWGKARRLEVLSMDEEKYTMSLCNSLDSEGGLVVGTSLPRNRMEAFITIFEDGLKF